MKILKKLLLVALLVGGQTTTLFGRIIGSKETVSKPEESSRRSAPGSSRVESSRTGLSRQQSTQPRMEPIVEERSSSPIIEEQQALQSRSKGRELSTTAYGNLLAQLISYVKQLITTVAVPEEDLTAKDYRKLSVAILSIAKIVNESAQKKGIDITQYYSLSSTPPLLMLEGGETQSISKPRVETPVESEKSVAKTQEQEQQEKKVEMPASAGTKGFLLPSLPVTITSVSKVEPNVSPQEKSAEKAKQFEQSLGEKVLSVTSPEAKSVVSTGEKSNIEKFLSLEIINNMVTLYREKNKDLGSFSQEYDLRLGGLIIQNINSLNGQEQDKLKDVAKNLLNNGMAKSLGLTSPLNAFINNSLFIVSDIKQALDLLAIKEEQLEDVQDWSDEAWNNYLSAQFNSVSNVYNKIESNGLKKYFIKKAQDIISKKLQTPFAGHGAAALTRLFNALQSIDEVK